MIDWATVPKTELHLHIEGAAPPDFIRTLAAEKNVDLSKIFKSDGSYVWKDFAEFLKTYEAACSVLKTPDDFRRLTEAVLDVSSANGVVYSEMFLSPDFCGGGDLEAWKDFLAAMTVGAQNSKAKHGIETRFISTCIRHFGPEKAVHTAKVTAATAGGLLTGYGMGGEERHLNASDFAESFEIARAAGLGLTSHAGEICGADSVRETLDSINVTRIGHGVRAIEDADLVARLAEEQIVLEVCPGSNIELNVFSKWADHPIVKLRDAGVPVTVSTDDPPYFHTDMTQEYRKLHETFGWGLTDFQAINREAMKAAFCDDETRQRIMAKFE
ncbi:adenosine deaminase [Rhodobacterales bacterium 52_120_T64]|nr:adenosine deaminase [Rhodobacterales bacterium 52_120_T64]